MTRKKRRPGDLHIDGYEKAYYAPETDDFVIEGITAVTNQYVKLWLTYTDVVNLIPDLLEGERQMEKRNLDEAG
jgi:hypothetical protein